MPCGSREENGILAVDENAAHPFEGTTCDEE